LIVSFGDEYLLVNNRDNIFINCCVCLMQKTCCIMWQLWYVWLLKAYQQ